MDKINIILYIDEHILKVKNPLMYNNDKIFLFVQDEKHSIFKNTFLQISSTKFIRNKKNLFSYYFVLTYFHTIFKNVCHSLSVST